MALDIEAVAGFTVKISDEIKNKNHEKYETEDDEELFDKTNIDHVWYGSCYTGDTKCIPLFVPRSAKNIDTELQKWLTDLNMKLNTFFSLDDVKFISETQLS